MQRNPSLDIFVFVYPEVLINIWSLVKKLSDTNLGVRANLTCAQDLLTDPCSIFRRETTARGTQQGHRTIEGLLLRNYSVIFNSETDNCFIISFTAIIESTTCSEHVEVSALSSRSPRECRHE